MAIPSWDEIKNFDEIIQKREREMISDLEAESKTKCPYSKKEGDFFFYCGKDMPKTEDKKPNPTHTIYKRHQSLAELSHHCLGEFESCCYFTGKMKFPDQNNL